MASLSLFQGKGRAQVEWVMVVQHEKTPSPLRLKLMSNTSLSGEKRGSGAGPKGLEVHLPCMQMLSQPGRPFLR